MTRKRQKRRELAVFEAFRKEFREFPLVPADADEMPDLLVKHRGQTIGIEITRLCTPEYSSSKKPYSTQALDGIRERIVRDAQNLYQGAAKPALAVKVWFCTHMRHTKLRPKRSQEIAVALCDLVNEWLGLSLQNGDLVPGGRVPEISRVSIERGVSVSQWERVPSPFLGNLLMEKTQEKIDKKNALYGTYRQKCGQCWLLMVTDRNRPGQAFRPSFYDSLRHHVFSCAFDRTFVLEVCPGYEELIELRNAR